MNEDSQIFTTHETLPHFADDAENSDQFWCVRDRVDKVRPMMGGQSSNDVTLSSAPYDRLTHPTGLS